MSGMAGGGHADERHTFPYKGGQCSVIAQCARACHHPVCQGFRFVKRSLKSIFQKEMTFNLKKKKREQNN